MKTDSVVVTAAGSVVGQGIIKCLKLANASSGEFSYKIIATDASPMAAGLYRGDSGHIVPEASDPGYVGAITDVARRAGAKAIFSGSDEELFPLSRESKKIERATGAKVLVNSERVLELCADKWLTYVFMKEHGIPAAESCVPESSDPFLSLVGFPVVVKPRMGHGSEGVQVARTREEVDFAVNQIERGHGRAMLQEYLDDGGNEYTTGVTVNEKGDRVMSCIALRRTLKGGQTYKAIIDDYDDVREAAKEVALRMGARGAVNVQSRISNGVPKVFEVNSRLSASCPIRAVAGVNEPDIIYRNFVRGIESEVMEYQKLVSMRYWNEVYVRKSTYDRTQRKRKFEGPDSAVLPYF